MKRKLCIIIPVIMIVVALLLVTVAALGLLFLEGNDFEIGRVVISEGEDDVFVGEDGQFWVMKEASILKIRIGEPKTGDKILVLRSLAMAESYPGQCAVKLCIKLENGDRTDISEAVIDELERIGWIN